MYTVYVHKMYKYQKKLTEIVVVRGPIHFERVAVDQRSVSNFHNSPPAKSSYDDVPPAGGRADRAGRRAVGRRRRARRRSGLATASQRSGPGAAELPRRRSELAVRPLDEREGAKEVAGGEPVHVARARRLVRSEIRESWPVPQG